MIDPNERIANALDVVERLRSGWRPGESALAEAVFIDDWLLVSDPAEDGTHSLYGVVSGHPRIREGRLTRTSIVLWLDPEAGIARTVSRWYRLGTPHALQRMAMTDEGEESPTLKM
ncbi:DUF6634 family protein [Methylosinus sp. PW1]|uniref:DUF6634 family protein n=1 Tax=Methylosinus sp. PW1 TaxID=107636 RepID=UPI00068C621A|nr:DUF6634 family protein [Methylosinus sp. PW1]